MEKFLKLRVWHKAKELVTLVYKVTAGFPSEERFGLVSQMRRAAISVMANIAEGSRKKSVKERQYFHEISNTSLEELKAYFYLSYDLGYINRTSGKRLIDLSREVGAMLHSLDLSIKIARL